MSRSPHVPHGPSRTPSRSGTPIPHLPSPSRLPVPPVLHSAPSLTSLRVYSRASSIAPTPRSLTPPIPSRGGESSSGSSSAMNLNIDLPAEGILIPEPEAEVDTADGEQATATARIDDPVADEEAKRHLRDQLRRTLSHKTSEVQATDTARYPDSSKRKGKGKNVDRAEDIQELGTPEVNAFAPRQYFVLTDAGKPVFISGETDESSDNYTSVIGLMQALISVFLDDNDKIRCINAGKTRITFLLRPPLYYACVSSWGEPESVTRFHLEYLHLQILSVVSAEQLRRMFQRRNNFDLRRLLSGAEPFLYSLLGRLEWDMAMSTSSLQCLKLDPVLRKRIADALVPTSKIKDILYVVLVAQGRVITLVRPKKHSIHPSDLHILINTIHSPSIINSSASASWLPICLPKFNPSAFVNAYVSFLRRPEDSVPSQAPTPSSERDAPVLGDASAQASAPSAPGAASPASPAPPTPDDRGSVAESASTADTTTAPPKPPVEIGLVCVSGLADFEAVRGWCATASETLEREGLMRAVVHAITRGTTEYGVGDLAVPGLRHFMYKSRAHVQITAPRYEEPYDDAHEQRRLITLYQILHDAIHAKSGQEGTLKLQYIRTERESVMGWITQPFELYLAMSPLLPKSAVVNAANAIARWVQKEEKRLFLRDAPVF